MTLPARQKRLSKAEYDYIHTDDEVKPTLDADAARDKAKVSWFKLLGYRQTWCFFFGKFMTDGVWWFYLFWLPDYLKKQFGMTKHEVTGAANLYRIACSHHRQHLWRQYSDDAHKKRHAGLQGPDAIHVPSSLCFPWR